MKKKENYFSYPRAILLIILVLVIVMIVVIPQVVENIRTLIDNLPDIFAQAEEWLNYLFEEIRLSPELLEKLMIFKIILHRHFSPL